jgi:hypothetical protein
MRREHYDTTYAESSNGSHYNATAPHGQIVKLIDSILSKLVRTDNSYGESSILLLAVCCTLLLAVCCTLNVEPELLSMEFSSGTSAVAQGC